MIETIIKILQIYLTDVEIKIGDGTGLINDLSKALAPGMDGAIQHRYNEMHELLNRIMDSSVMYDEDTLKMANSAIEHNRRWATEARVILRRMMK